MYKLKPLYQYTILTIIALGVLISFFYLPHIVCKAIIAIGAL